MICALCSKRTAIRGDSICQRCRHRLYPMHGPVHEPDCGTCRDSGRIEIDRYHARMCECGAGRSLVAAMRQRQAEAMR